MKKEPWTITFGFSDMSKREREFFAKECKAVIKTINTTRQQVGREQTECCITKHSKQERDRITTDMIALFIIYMLLGLVSIIGLILR